MKTLTSIQEGSCVQFLGTSIVISLKYSRFFVADKRKVEAFLKNS